MHRKSNLFLILSTILMFVLILSNRNITIYPAKPEIDVEISSEPTPLEDEEFDILMNSEFEFIRRYATTSKVIYEVKNIPDNFRVKLNELSTNLYLMWYKYGYDPKIIIQVIDDNDNELVIYGIENGKIFN